MYENQFADTGGISLMKENRTVPGKDMIVDSPKKG
jgi:hypothetical protein